MADLKGPPHDVARIERLLRGRFGFSADSIRTLVDGEATLEAVVTAFHAHLIEGVTPDTEVVFFFAGHGSLVPDAAGVEEVGDATLVLHDSRVGALDGSRELDDDALHSLLRACPSQRITVITDACHSGEVTRGAEGHIPRSAPLVVDRSAPAGVEGWPFWPDDVVFLEDGDARRLAPRNWVHVAACRTHEKAYEFALQDPPEDYPEAREFGALSHALCGYLLELSAGEQISWQDLTQRVSQWLRYYNFAQHARWSGPAHRHVFGPGADVDLPGIPCHTAGPGPDGEGVRLRLDGGLLHGLKPGAELELFRAATGAEPIGSAQVTRVWAGGAAAIAPTLDSLDPGGMAHLVARPIPGQGVSPLAVHLPADFTAGRGADLRAVDRLPVEWVDDPEAPHRIEVQAGGGFQLVARDGLVLHRHDGGEIDVAQLRSSCSREARFWWLWDLQENVPGGSLAVRLQLQQHATPGIAHTIPAALEPQGPGRYLLAFPSNGGASAAPQPLISTAMLSGTCQSQVHLIVFDLDRSSRRVTALQPGHGARSESTVRSMPEIGPMGFLPPAVDVPPGEAFNRFVAVVCLRPLDLCGFESGGVVSPQAGTRGGGGTIDSRGLGIATLDVIAR